MTEGEVEKRVKTSARETAKKREEKLAFESKILLFLILAECFTTNPFSNDFKSIKVDLYTYIYNCIFLMNTKLVRGSTELPCLRHRESRGRSKVDWIRGKLEYGGNTVQEGKNSLNLQ